MAYVLKEQQRKALHEFMNKYGVDAGIGATLEFEQTGKFGKALLNWTPRGRLIHRILHHPFWTVGEEGMEFLPIDLEDWDWDKLDVESKIRVRIALYLLKTYNKDLKSWEE